jgi:LCP family protein required for cell wall assembly
VVFGLQRRPGYRVRSRARLVLAAALVLVLLAGAGLWASGYYLTDYIEEMLYEAGLSETPPEPAAYKGRINVLLLGTDARKGEKTGRSDTIMLCSVDTDKNLMSVLSIPRDTRVRIPGRGWDKINSATIYGGPDLAMKTVSDLLGIRVNNFVLCDYEGFKDVIDALGGVTVDVKERMYHHDPQDGGIYTIDLRPGVQRLDGEKALQYVRYRDYALGDIDRAEQQQRFLSALAREVLQPGTVVKLPSLIVSVSKAIDTNLSLMDMKRLAVAARNMTNASIVTQTLPGRFLNLDGGSYWEVDPGQASLTVARLFEGRDGGQVVLGETTVVSTGAPQPAGRDLRGKMAPPGDGRASGEKDAKAGAPGARATEGSRTSAGTQPKAGSSGKTAGTAAKGQAGTGTDNGKTGSKDSQSTSQPAGSEPAGSRPSESPSTGTMIVPPPEPRQDREEPAGEPPVTVIIETKSN